MANTTNHKNLSLSFRYIRIGEANVSQVHMESAKRLKPNNNVSSVVPAQIDLNADDDSACSNEVFENARQNRKIDLATHQGPTSVMTSASISPVATACVSSSNNANNSSK